MIRPRPRFHTHAAQRVVVVAHDAFVRADGSMQ
jgi:hypothetical protein